MTSVARRAALIWRFCRHKLGVVGLVGLVGGLLVLPDLIAFKLATRAMRHGGLQTDLDILLLAMPVLGVYLVKGLLVYASNNLSVRLASEITSAVQKDLYARLLAMRCDSLMRERIGDHIASLSTSAGYVQQVVLSLARIALADGLTVGAYLVVIAHTSPIVALTLVVLAPPYAIALYAQHKAVLRLSTKAMKQRADWLSFLEERLRFVEMIKVFGSERIEADRFGTECDNLVRVECEQATRRALVGPFLELILGFGAVSIVFISARSLNAGTAEPADIVMCGGLALMVLRPMNRIVTAIGTVAQRSVHLDRIEETYALTEAEQCQVQLRFERADEVELALTGVSVRRNGGPLVLRDVNLRLGGPGLVGVTGRSGAGKSTLGRALAGLVPAETGEIRMLHTAESEHPPLYLPQDTKLLNQPVLQTICYPSTDADEEAATSVARALDLLPLLESLGATSVGQDGNAVSGGERRRLALANVLYHHREVFVLDEPLEGVHRALADRATAYLKRLSRTKLVVVITHRPEILKMAEDVIFIARGTVAARGSHSDLLRDCPEYAENFEARTRQDAASPSERVDAAMAGLVTAAQCTQGAQAK